MAAPTLAPVTVVIAAYSGWHLWKNGRVAFSPQAARILTEHSTDARHVKLRRVITLERIRTVSFASLALLFVLAFIIIQLGASAGALGWILLLPLIPALPILVCSFLIGFQGGLPRDEIMQHRS